MDLSDKDGLRWLSQLVSDLRAAAPDHEPLLVGAMARDLLLHYGAGVPVQRATTDVDLAFAVPDWDEFNAVHRALLASEWFTATESVEHKLRHRETLEIDLIPFGGVEDAAGQIVWPGDESLMRVLGYPEAWATSLEILLPEGQRISSVSLPMLAAIKVVAWADRHTLQPRKDASDLLLILKNYLNEENTTRLYDEAAHLLETDDFDYESAGAWLAGHDAAAGIASTSPNPPRLFDALRAVLNDETDADGKLRLIGECGLEPESALSLLRSFRDGLFAERS